MTKPTKEELEVALAKAAEMKEHGEDTDFLAKSLLNTNYRLDYMEKVFHAAEKYVLFGQDETNHALLVRAIEHARRQERYINKVDEPPTHGL